MSSIHGLPARGSNAKILLTRVHMHPQCIFVEFWGKFSLERSKEYESLTKDIQSPGLQFQFLDGIPGDKCLVQIDDIWYRCYIVSSTGSNYSVFLIDKGITCNTVTDKLAWGNKEHFLLPPEVEFCVLANVLPVSLENKWSPVALDFLRSLPGKCLDVHVQEVLVQQRIFVLNIPCLATQMCQMGFAKKLSPDSFLGFLLASLESKKGTEIISQAKEPVERLRKENVFFYPELPEGTVETVIVTEVVNPQRIFCQLKVFSRELMKLSEQLRHICEGRVSTCLIDSEMIGFPCAARGSEGRWYRSVLQQVCPTGNVIEVLNVDYGTKQYVQMKNVRPLGAEFFRMPVVTYICSLHGVGDKGLGWTASQTEHLKSLLLFKAVIAKFEYHSLSEGVHYVTLYADNNTNINNLFTLKEKYFSQSEKTGQNFSLQSQGQDPQDSKHKQKISLLLGMKQTTDTLPVEDLPVDSTHKVVVQHISNPSEFWIQTQTLMEELDNLMDGLYLLYKDSPSADALKSPTIGVPCAVKLKTGDIYRATVAEVGAKQVKVLLVDYGNSEVVERMNIRPLPTEFQMLPRLAYKCSLSGVKPKDAKWSQSASDFFFNVVINKTLDALVTAKSGDGYSVQLSILGAQVDQDVGLLMCSHGFAEKATGHRPPKTKITVQSDRMPPIQHPDKKMPFVSVDRETSSQNPNLVCFPNNERRVPIFKEHMFPIGSVLDVTVSSIKSPSDFWCQLVQNAGHLKLLMQELQVHYANSVFVSPVETACVVRHPDSGKWYRGLVIHKHVTPHVDVLLVDYGQTKTVSLYDTRSILPEFLTLNGQAFRCSLLNPTVPTSATVEWNAEAVARFHSFVKTSASNFVILKCTIFAVMFSEQKIVFNVVDLETPFESICTSMVNLIKSVPEKAEQQSLRLETYYYSTHNVKTGTEEQVTVTCVNNASEFYCQLEKNSEVLKTLQKKVSVLCNQLKNEKHPAVFGPLCFVRYTDGQWYRGQIKAKKPAHVVHFVDYGDTIEVGKSDLLPVPKQASDIMSIPVQAVVCGLADVCGDIPTKAASWFETHVTEGKFQALIVAKEPDGKLMVELYHGNMQINDKLKKLFHLKMPDEQAVFQRDSYELTKVSPKPANADQTQPLKRNCVSGSKLHQIREDYRSMDPNPALKCKRETSINSQKFKSMVFRFYTPPHQRPSGDCNQSRDHVPSKDLNFPRNQNNDIEAKHPKSKSPLMKCEQENKVKKLPKLADLPPQSITANLTADVYVSHCNSPLSFYVQRVRDEEELNSLVEKLNSSPTMTKTNEVQDVQPGDLVQAEFAVDSSWYRAVVRELHDTTTAHVEFVDFGNAAVTPFSSLQRLDESLLLSPVYSTHCMLSEAVAQKKETILAPDVVSGFKDDVCGCSGEKVLQCRFIRKVGAMWEVSLEDSGINVVCKVPTQLSQDTSGSLEKESARLTPNTEKEPATHCFLLYSQQEFLEAQRLQVFITAINDDLTFWCQCANSKALDEISSRLAEVGDKKDHKCISEEALSPGSVCIALYSEDQLWYRAEVINTNGTEATVLFVDYGNISSVNTVDLREIPPNMIEVPQQAFLCFLEGFDTLCGSWLSCAHDEFSALTVDKSVELTVTKVIKEEKGKIQLAVHLEVEGMGLIETMKSWWRCVQDDPEEPFLEQPSNVTDSAVKQPELDKLEQSLVPIEHGEHKMDIPTYPRFKDEAPMLAKGSDVVCLEESENSQDFPELQNNENEELPNTDETKDIFIGENDEQVVSSSSFTTCLRADKDIDEESSLMVEPGDKHEPSSPEELRLLERVVLDPQCQHKEEQHSPRRSAMSSFSGPAQQVHQMHRPLKHSSVMMVPREGFAQINKIDSRSEGDTISQCPPQFQTTFILPDGVDPTEHLVGEDVSGEQETDQRRAPGVLPTLESMTEVPCRDELPIHQKDMSDVDDAPTDLQPDKDLSPEVAGLSVPTEPSDSCTESKEFDDCEVPDSRADGQGSETAEDVLPQTDTDQNTAETIEHAEESTEVQNEQPASSTVINTRRPEFQEEDIIPNEDDLNQDSPNSGQEDCGSISDSDTVVYVDEAPELIQLVEEVTCLVGDISLTDSGQDPKGEAEDSDLPVPTFPQETEGSNGL